jgi:hypothetical protein
METNTIPPGATSEKAAQDRDSRSEYKIVLNIETKPSDIVLARTADGVSFFLTRERYVALNGFLLETSASRFPSHAGYGMASTPMRAQERGTA